MTILASSRSGWIEFIDPATLQVKGRLYSGPATESVVASADGKTLFITKPRSGETGCCALFAINLKTRTTTELLWPSGAALVVPKANKIFTQRGNVGIEVFDSKTLARLPTINAPGVYGLYPSPDERWMFGTNSMDQSTIDVFDIQKSLMMRRIRIPSNGSLSGAWLGNYFYLYAQDQNRGHLWKVPEDATELDSGLAIQLPGLAAEKFMVWSLVPADRHLLVFELFGTKFDSRSFSSSSSAGGVYEIDPANGAVIGSLVPELHFYTLRVDSHGEKVFGIDVGSQTWDSVRLVKFDRRSGHVDAVRELTPGVWHLSLSDVPAELVPQDH